VTELASTPPPLDARAAGSAWRLHPARVAVSISAGTIVGGAATAILAWLLASFDGNPIDTGDLGYALVGLGMIWFVVICVPGAAAWFIMHRIGRRGWLSALAVGAGGGAGLAMATSLMLLLRDPLGTLAGIIAAAIFTALGAFLGAVVALTMWRIAYRRGPDTDVASVFT
jgi:hypothetical protein